MCCFALIGLLVATAARANPDVRTIDARVRGYVDSGLFSGVVLVSNRGAVVYEKAFGFAERAFGVANTTTTKFHIASVSKPITAAAILLLADRGKLSIGDPVSKFAPGFPNGDRITLEQVLTHYSGLDDASSSPDYDDWARFPQTPQTLVDRLAKLPMKAEPGAAYSYSNSNYHLLALIIEKVSGMPYGEFLAANLFKPLGMNSSGHPGDDRAVIDHLAAGYMPKGDAGFDKPPYFDWTAKTGNGSLYSTARDLLAFHQALASGALLKPETVTASYGFGRTDRKVGMFWLHADVNGHRAVYMNGSSPGFKTTFECFVDDDVCVIALSNIYLAAVTPMVKDIASILWEPAKALPAMPKRVARTAAELAKVASNYTFDAKFYQPNAVAKVSVEGSTLVLRYGTVTTTLVPLADGSYLDRLYWSFIRFDGENLIYRNGSSEFTAPRSR